MLAASDVEHTKVELLDPPAAAAIGERVTFEGLKEFGRSRPPRRRMGGVRKAWDATQPMLGTRPTASPSATASPSSPAAEMHRRDDRQRPDRRTGGGRVIAEPEAQSKS